MVHLYVQLKFRDGNKTTKNWFNIVLESQGFPVLNFGNLIEVYSLELSLFAQLSS